MTKFRQLLRIEDLSAGQVKKIIETAYANLQATKIAGRKTQATPLALVFAESSTRTRVSFERAARTLGLDTYLLEQSSSSLTKGEDLKDTVLNLHAMGIRSFVVRTPSTAELLSLRDLPVSIVNAGDGVGEHPTQALLDLLCLFEKYGASWTKLLNAKICIVGNLSHSRVVNSWMALAKLLRIPIRLVSPTGWQPRDLSGWTERLSEGLEGADVIMALRVQKERLTGDTGSPVSVAEYVDRYQVTAGLLLGRPLMHPGPINWGVELETGLRDYANSLILDQVRCGYYLRATLLNDFIAS